jgi:hypothetical protein
MKRNLFVILLLTFVLSISFTSSQRASAQTDVNHWAAFFGNNTLVWNTLYTGFGALSYDLYMDEEWYDSMYIPYHQILLTYFAPNYTYDVDLRSSNKYYDASNNFKGGVPYTQWGKNTKYSHIYDGRKASFGGGNTNEVSIGSVNAIAENTTQIYAYGENGWLYLDEITKRDYIGNTLLTNELERNINQEPEQPKNLESIKSMAQETDESVNNMSIKDESLKKWVIRVNLDSKLRNKSLSDNEIMEQAISINTRREAWFELASQYGATVTDDELDAYIDKIENQAKATDTIKMTNDIAEGLGYTLDEFFHNFDRDHYKRNLIWQKLRPTLEEKYPKYKDENNLEYNNRLVNAFNEEVAEYLQIVKN